jgi:hypothetical protein
MRFGRIGKSIKVELHVLILQNLQIAAKKSMETKISSWFSL